MGRHTQIGSLEEIVLTAVRRLRGQGYGLSLCDEIEKCCGGRRVSLGALYATLDRLQGKGFISSREADASAERGGRPRRYVSITAAGVRALEESWEGLKALRRPTGAGEVLV